MFTNEDLHKRIRLLEEEIMYLHKDMAHLIGIYENMKPEVHTHYTLITENLSCEACEETDPTNPSDLDELM